ncbi:MULTISPECIES: hypothetical protein [Mycobacteriaceae]|uniref:hypothetical protein n=1 Tax=Mycobacteriaceae TaxID=1762 RepID=UPI000A0710CB|nr:MULTISPECIES: hypothetical protein [Mycobacteriaceae]MBU8841062.1 hypothetical protein [Mycolicibacterium goodii]UCN12926.1 hypothetical protein LFT50_28960 [Mycobacterium intracellulare subsp. chimaera]
MSFMPGRINSVPLDVTGSSVSVLTPADEDYLTDAQSYGVDSPAGRWVVGIGTDYPDVVLIGHRDQLVALATDILNKLG